MQLFRRPSHFITLIACATATVGLTLDDVRGAIATRIQRSLRAAGIGSVVGMAIYTGTLSLGDVPAGST